MTLKYKILPNCPIPAPIKPPHYPGDVGYDLGVAIRTESVVIQPYSFDDVRTFVCIELPPNCWGDIRSRSSTFSKRRLFVMSGTIDNSYRGELSVFLYNPNPTPVVIHRGDYLAQLVIMPIIVPSMEAIDVLSKTERNESGFGSSGGYREDPKPS